jgi:hypothetical protein
MATFTPRQRRRGAPQSGNRRRRTHTATEIGMVIDRAARVRLRRAIQDAVRCPSAENVAVLQEWPSDWVAEEQAVYGVPQPRRKTILDVAVGNASGTPARTEKAWQWVAGWAAAILTLLPTTGRRVMMRMKAAIDDHNTDFQL